MNMPKLKARDGIGRYTTKRRIYVKWFIRLLIVFISVNFITGLLVDFNNWSSTHKVQSPLLVSTNNGNQLLTITKQDVIVEQPIVIISPVVEQVVENTDMQNLKGIEQIVFDKFGATNFQLAMAVVNCESGGDIHAINWGSKDIGLFQINLPVWGQVIHEQFGYTIVDLLDPVKNTEVAYYIFDRDGDGKGSWNPWVGFWNGCALSSL